MSKTTLHVSTVSLLLDKQVMMEHAYRACQHMAMQWITTTTMTTRLQLRQLSAIISHDKLAVSKHG